MQLLNEFEVALPPERTWTLLTDLEKVAPCLPGASITSVDGDDYHGRAKIKVGPITAEYKGTAQFTELRADSHTAVLLARGKDSRGQGEASATVTASLAASGSGTTVTVETDLALTGKVAQFGRGVLAEVSGALMGLFAERLQDMVVAEGMAPEVQPSPGTLAPAVATSPEQAVAAGGDDVSNPAPTGSRRPSAGGQDEALDVLSLAGGVPWTKALPAAGTLISVLAALVSVFAAGYATSAARSAGH